MQKRTAIAGLLILSLLGLIASTWLGCALSDRWTVACQIQGIVCAIAAIFSAGHFIADAVA